MKRLFILASALVIYMLPTTSWCGKITDIVITQEKGINNVQVVCDTALEAKDYANLDDKVFILDVYNADFVFKDKIFKIMKGVIDTITTKKEQTTTKVIIKLNEKPAYILISEDPNIRVVFTTKKVELFDEWKASLSPEVVKPPAKKATKKKGVKK